MNFTSLDQLRIIFYQLEIVDLHSALNVCLLVYLSTETEILLLQVLFRHNEFFWGDDSRLFGCPQNVRIFYLLPNPPKFAPNTVAPRKGLYN